MNNVETKNFLDSFINYEFNLDEMKRGEFKLERVQGLLKRLDCLSQDCPVIHVAGTKGKGSTCMMTASILASSGYRVGLYTSPHVHSFTERIRVLEKGQGEGGKFKGSITQEALAELVSRWQDVIEKYRGEDIGDGLSYFEVLTALALRHFKDVNVDCVVLETGLGGRLDATNAIKTDVCGITSISLEHTKILGETLTQIAAEKVAIIKSSDQKVVMGIQNSEAQNVFDKRCEEFEIVPIKVNDDVTLQVHNSDNRLRQKFSIQTPEHHYESLELPLSGEHQLKNAAMAIVLAESLYDKGFNIFENSVRQGLATLHWPLRFEMISDDPMIIVDCAHNDSSFAALKETLQTAFPNLSVTLIVGVSSDKNLKAICSIIDSFADTVIWTQANHPRARNIKEEDIGGFMNTTKSYFTHSVEEALKLAADEFDNPVLVVAGSFFVAAEARQNILKG